MVLLFRQFIDKVEASRGDSPLPASLACEALHELGNEARHAERGRLTLSTVHGAKGREFRHVVILDGGNWRQADEEERRLYYVAMRRERGRRWRSARPTATATLSRRRSPPLSSGATPCRRPSSGRRSSRCAPATAVSSVV
ncbi:MAG TPA: ATP-binding domain-containing protein [Accumulibacter sp.]|nr:ATP-binding domain-containing protein [Accumulibacter sp.]